MMNVRPFNGLGSQEATLACLLIFALVQAGCYGPLVCSHRDVFLEWKQPEVYERFPEEEKAPEGYGVVWYRNIDAKSAYKEGARVEISVKRAENVTFYMSQASEISDSRAARELNATFAALDLGTPSPPAWRFRHGTPGC